jgi:hypothetical protein
MGLLNLEAIEILPAPGANGVRSINQQLSWQRDPMSDEVVENLLAGYAYVDILVDGVSTFLSWASTNTCLN